jgi:hypothetical protein
LPAPARSLARRAPDREHQSLLHRAGRRNAPALPRRAPAARRGVPAVASLRRPGACGSLGSLIPATPVEDIDEEPPCPPGHPLDPGPAEQPRPGPPRPTRVVHDPSADVGSCPWSTRGRTPWPPPAIASRRPSGMP